MNNIFESLKKFKFDSPVIVILNNDKDISKNHDTYKLPFNLKGNIEILEKATKERVIAGYASIIEVDEENQLIPRETLIEGIETLLSNSEYANLMLVHQNIQIGKVLKEWGDLKTHVDDKGLFIVAKIREDLRTANEIWQQILDHKLNGFSIAAEVLVDHEECDDKKCITVIDKINIFEISVCSKPVNKNSGFIIMSKAKDNKIEDVKTSDVCKDCSIKGNHDMKEEDKISKDTPEEKPETIENDEDEIKTEEVEEKTEEKDIPTEPETVEEDQTSDEQEEEVIENEESEEEPSLEDTIASLSREVEALKGIINEMKAEPMEEEPEEEVEEEPEEEMTEEEKADPVEDEEYEDDEEVEYPYPSKKDFDTLKESVDSLIEKFAKLDELDELKKSIKSKDEQLCSLNKRLEIVEKSEEKSKVLVDSEEQSEEETKKLELIRDPYRTGVIYRDL